MGVYINGMEMPKGRPVCIVIDAAGQVRRYDLNNDRYADDKLFEAVFVPEHGDLIDADKLVELCDIMADKCDGIGASIWHQFKTTVEWSPIVIPAEEGET